MIRRRQGLSNYLFPQYTSILLSSWNHQISKITSFKSRVMVLFVCNMQIMLCNQCHTWLTNLLNYYNYMLKAKDYNVLYYFLKKKNYDRNGISYEATVIRGNGPHCIIGAWGGVCMMPIGRDYKPIFYLVTLPNIYISQATKITMTMKNTISDGFSKAM